ncbi:MAG: alpha/beta hydrolase [Phycisphaerae bacterium]|nr:alpha/beta hydrolase [Phycisphaerae bacterium]
MAATACGNENNTACKQAPWGQSVPPADDDADAAGGVVLFVESIRWLGVRWGMKSCAAGLRQAGFSGEFRYWRWHAAWRGWLVLPAIMAGGKLQHQAEQLAEFITQKRREHPDMPIHVIGYSCGGYVATRAIEMLPAGIAVDSLALLAAAVSPKRDLNVAAERVKGSIVVSSSCFDAVILGLGTLLFGTGDRMHSFSVGSVGYRGADCPKVINLRWTPAMLPAGNLGGHFTAPAQNYIRKWIAPKMGITSL